MKQKILLILLIFIPFLSEGQSFLKGFFRLSGPEKCWVFDHLFTAGKAFRIVKEARISTDEILRDSLLDQFPNGGQVDAFRHTYWMARTTQKIGDKRAFSLGIAHEKGNYQDFKKGRLEDGFRTDSISCVMDLLNNSTGIQTGRILKDSSSIYVRNYIIDLVKNGKVVILKRNDKGELTNCQGETVPPSDEWMLPYCIIASDKNPLIK